MAVPSTTRKDRSQTVASLSNVDRNKGAAPIGANADAGFADCPVGLPANLRLVEDRVCRPAAEKNTA
jgi:hypothetical protein